MPRYRKYSFPNFLTSHCNQCGQLTWGGRGSKSMRPQASHASRPRTNKNRFFWLLPSGLRACLLPPSRKKAGKVSVLVGENVHIRVCAVCACIHVCVWCISVFLYVNMCACMYACLCVCLLCVPEWQHVLRIRKPTHVALGRRYRGDFSLTYTVNVRHSLSYTVGPPA